MSKIIKILGSGCTNCTSAEKRVQEVVKELNIDAQIIGPSLKDLLPELELNDWAGLYGDATESFARGAFAYLPVVSQRGDLRK